MDFTLLTPDGSIGKNISLAGLSHGRALCSQLKPLRSEEKKTAHSPNTLSTITYPYTTPTSSNEVLLTSYLLLLPSLQLGARSQSIIKQASHQEKLSTLFNSSELGQRKQRSILHISSSYCDGLAKCKKDLVTGWSIFMCDRCVQWLLCLGKL